MKKLLCALVLISLFAGMNIVSAHEDPPKTKAERNNAEELRQLYRDSKVRKVFCFKYEYSQGVQQLPKIRLNESTYDTNGCMVERLLWRNDSVISRELRFFNDNLQLSSVLDFKDGKMYTRVERYEYTPEGLISQVMDMSAQSKLLGSLDYLYDAGRKLIVAEKTDSAGKVEYSVEYLYSPSLSTGLCTAVVQKNSKGEQLLRVENKYDGDGLRTEKRVFSATDKLDYYFAYTYTGSGKLSEIVKYNAEGKRMEGDRYAYNDAGFLISVTSYNELNEVSGMLEYVYYMPPK